MVTVTGDPSASCQLGNRTRSDRPAGWPLFGSVLDGLTWPPVTPACGPWGGPAASTVSGGSGSATATRSADRPDPANDRRSSRQENAERQDQQLPRPNSYHGREDSHRSPNTAVPAGWPEHAGVGRRAGGHPRLRSAILGTQIGLTGFPPYIYVEELVRLRARRIAGLPHLAGRLPPEQSLARATRGRCAMGGAGTRRTKCGPPRLGGGLGIRRRSRMAGRVGYPWPGRPSSSVGVGGWRRSWLYRWLYS